jgi:hypothetical protein
MDGRQHKTDAALSEKDFSIYLLPDNDEATLAATQIQAVRMAQNPERCHAIILFPNVAEAKRHSSSASIRQAYNAYMLVAGVWVRAGMERQSIPMGYQDFTDIKDNFLPRAQHYSQQIAKEVLLRSNMALLTQAIYDLKLLRYPCQIEHLIKIDERFRNFFNTKLSELAEKMPDNKLTKKEIEKSLRTSALEHTFQALKNRIADLEDCLQKIASQHVKTKSQGKNPFDKLPMDVLGYLYTFTDKPFTTISAINRKSRQLIHGWDWRSQLQHNFEMPPEYIAYIVNATDTPTQAKNKLKIVYQRLAHVKAKHKNIFNLFYRTLLTGCIDFPPLTVTTPSIPDFDTNKLEFYYNEALRLKNVYLIEYILTIVLIDKVKTYAAPKEFIAAAAIDALKQTRNLPLLSRMLPLCANYRDAASIVMALNEGPQPKHLLADCKGADELNVLIYGGQFDAARKLLQSGMVPNSGIVSLYDLGWDAPDYLPALDFGLYLLGVIEVHPHLLQEFSKGVQNDRAFPWAVIESKATRSFCQFLSRLTNHACRDIHDKGAAESLTRFYQFLKKKGYNKNSELISSSIKNKLPVLAAADGNLSIFKSQLANKEEGILINLLSTAIHHGRVNIVAYMIKRFGTNILFSYDSGEAILNTRHKAIIKYLVNDLKEPGLAIKINDSYLLGEPILGLENIDDQSAPIAMAQAIRNRWTAIVEYLVEDCHVKPDLDMIKTAIEIENTYVMDDNESIAYDLFIYLQNRCPDVSLTLDSEMLRNMSWKPTALISSWLNGPEGRKKHFQFTLEHLKDCLSHHKRPLIRAIIKSEEFPSLFAGLTEDEKAQFVLLRGFGETASKVILRTLLAEPDKNSKILQHMKLSREDKEVDFAHALILHDKELASVYINRQHPFLYLATSWADILKIKITSPYGINDNSHFSIDDFFAINANMLAWLEKTAISAPISSKALQHFTELFGTQLCLMLNYSYGKEAPDSGVLHKATRRGLSVTRGLKDELYKSLVEIFSTAFNYQRVLSTPSDSLVSAKKTDQANVSSVAQTTTQSSSRLFSLATASSSESSLSPSEKLETILEMHKHFNKLTLLETKDDYINDSIQQIRADINVMERKIRESQRIASTIPTHLLERMEKNIDIVRQHLNDDSFITCTQKMSECCKKLSTAFSPPSSQSNAP